jgi:hypothetical protein
MADENIKDFGVSWIQLGVVLFCLITFATIFMAQNNPIGLGTDASTQLGITSDNISSSIFQVTNETDALLNISANTNPTEGYLGSRDSVASSYGIMGVASSFFTSTKTLISWVFGGAIGEMLLVLFGGLFSLASLYWIIKWVRNGL